MPPAQADLEFHRYVWQCSGNETLCSLLEQVTAPLFAFISVLRSHDLHKLHHVGGEPYSAGRGAPKPRSASHHRGLRNAAPPLSYEPFLQNGNPMVAATAYGFLETLAADETSTT